MENNQILLNAVASLEMEGMSPTRREREIAKDWIDGNIDSDSAVKTIIDIYSVRS